MKLWVSEPRNLKNGAAFVAAATDPDSHMGADKCTAQNASLGLKRPGDTTHVVCRIQNRQAQHLWGEAQCPENGAKGCHAEMFEDAHNQELPGGGTKMRGR